MFLKTVKQVKLEVRPLFLPQLVQLTSLLKPGLTRIRVRHFRNEMKSVLFTLFFLLTFSGQTRSGWNFMRNAKMPSKHSMCWLYEFTIFMLIAF